MRGALPPLLDGGKRLKQLGKMIGKGEVAKRDVRHIERSGADLDY